MLTHGPCLVVRTGLKRTQILHFRKQKYKAKAKLNYLPSSTNPRIFCNPSFLVTFSSGLSGRLAGVQGLGGDLSAEKRADVGPDAVCVCTRELVQDALGPL